MKSKKPLIIFLSFFLTGKSQEFFSGLLKSLCAKYQSFFSIGAAVSRRILKSADGTLNIIQYNSIVCEMTPELEQRQADYYRTCFNVFREKKDKISLVTFWIAADN